MQSVQTAVDTLDLVVVLVDPPVIGEHSCPCREVVVVRHDRAAVAVGLQVLTGVETETGDMAYRSDPPPLVVRPVRLRGILNDFQPVSVRQAQKRIHIRRLPVEMHGDDGFEP